MSRCGRVRLPDHAKLLSLSRQIVEQRVVDDDRVRALMDRTKVDDLAEIDAIA